MAAVLLMLLALVTQFNSIYQALLVLSAIVFSTAGFLVGLITGRPFGIVMGGIGERFAPEPCGCVLSS